MDDVYNELLKYVQKEDILINEPMSKHTTFKIGGNADLFIKVRQIDILKNILKIVKKYKIKVFVIGNGSNLLVSDKGIRGIVINLKTDYIEKINDTTYKVAAGVPIGKLSGFALKNSLTGIEFASGIPGTIGGAIKMNAGAYGGEIKDVIISTKYLDKNLEEKIIDNKAHEFSYRKSIFQKNKGIILETIIKLEKGDKAKIEEFIKEKREKRMMSQPLLLPNAGSIFKRGEGYTAGELIDKAGLKGFSIGDASVSEKHAGFIVNKGNATASEVLTLIDYIKKEVKQKYDINLELELEIIGEK